VKDYSLNNERNETEEEYYADSDVNPSLAESNVDSYYYVENYNNMMQKRE